MTAMYGMQAIAQVSAVRIVDCLFEGTLIALLAGFASRLSKRQSSATRFVIWFCALMAIATSPLLSALGSSRAENLSGGLGRAAITLPSSWGLYAFGLWAAIAIWLLARVGVGLWRLRALRKSFVPVDVDRLDARVRKTLQGERGARPIPLCTSDRIQVPAAIGLAEAIIVIPTWMMVDISADELKQILLHELAHLRRRDDWTNLVQQIVKALFFFHPAVWWIEKKISLEREMACDDAVIAETESPRAYAECLQHMAEKTLVRRTLALAQAALGRVRQTSLRVAQILDAKRLRGKTQIWRTALPLTGFVMVCALFGAKEPRLIAFQDSQPVTANAAIAPYGNVHVTPAAFTTREEPTPKILAQARSTRIGLAKDKTRKANAAPRQFERTERSLVADRSIYEQIYKPSLVHFASSSTTPAVIQTVFLFVQESSTPGGSVFEIQVWRLTVLRPAVRSSSNEIPHKEI
jgi:beta-lactamase regulating signal transducer with metallopeptidase domain